ncbi:hypothetical protein BC834DRAFT_157452 [Gloeopeniophorella convolvens]|nr:hypothetical protein BC834DRAFT_157452 [Gloeopeniophorella convolvens]
MIAQQARCLARLAAAASSVTLVLGRKRFCGQQRRGFWRGRIKSAIRNQEVVLTIGINFGHMYTMTSSNVGTWSRSAARGRPICIISHQPSFPNGATRPSTRCLMVFYCSRSIYTV